MKIGVSGRVIENHVGGNSRYVEELQKHLPGIGIDYIPLRSGGPELPGPPGLRYAISESLWALKPPVQGLDLLHFPSDTGPLIAGRLPIIATIHGVASLHMDDVRTPAAERSWRMRVRRLADLATKVITVSESSANDISRVFGIPAAKIRAIPHGIDHDKFHPNYRDRDSATLSGLDLPERFILYLGNLDPRKNVTRLCEAVDMLNSGGTEYPLIIAGKAAWGYEPTLEAIGRSPHITYLGSVPDDIVAPLLRRASLFVFPSLYEGFGFPVLEAMACGTPVVCSNRGALAEVAKDAAIIVDPLNVPEMAAAIESVWSSDEEQRALSEKGILNSLNYSWESSAKAHGEVFHAALDA